MILPIIPTHCENLGLPTPREYESQYNYIKRLLIEGCNLNTREARYIGIHNLHSLISKLKAQGFPVSVQLKAAIDPRTQEKSPYRVDHVWANDEDVKEWKAKLNKKGKAPTEAEA